MIKTWRHKGLEDFYTTGSTRRIYAGHEKRLRLRLRVIDLAEKIEDINLSGYQLHPLKGNRQGIWSITVTGNWRITFEFKEGDAWILNYEEHH